MRILFDSKKEEFKSPFGTLSQNEPCCINIHIPKSCKTVSVKLILNEENAAEYAVFSLKKSGEYDGYEIYSCRFAVADAGLYFYYFRITTENEQFSLYKQDFDMTNMEEGSLWQLSCIPSDFHVPQQYAGKVMYQIFPDRFHKSGQCDLSGKLEPYWLHENTNDVPDFCPDEKGVVRNCDFFGGNLRGIAEKMEYLAELGVSVIYLNPIFKAYSNHRYDTADYMKIDEVLGTEEDFTALCDKAHEYGIKIILDGVFSHTGSNSVYFDKEGIFGNGAYSNPESPYREWYDFQHYPDEYTSWWGINTLPCVNEMSDSFREYIISGEDSVIAHWLYAGADGFRLDVADELPDEFIAQLRRRMKQIKPESLLIGEVWEDASNKSSYGTRRKYFTGYELDSVMNYPFRTALINYISGADGGIELRNTVMTIAENYPKEVLLSLMNMISTHDTPRILSVFGCQNPDEDKAQRAVFRLSEEQLKHATEKLMCAAFLQFVLPGMPCIFYGDEIGTQGLEDPFCRSYFDWCKTENNPILTHYKELSKIRNGSKTLQTGSVEIETDKNGLVCVIRKTDNVVYRAYANANPTGALIEPVGEVIFSGRTEPEDNGVRINQYGYMLLREEF